MLPISSSSKNEEEEKEKKIEMNKLDSSNNEPIKIYNSNDFEIPKIEPEYHIGPCLGLLILLCNIIIPGTGTFIACCKMKDPTLRSQLKCNGLCQLLTFPLFVGWVMALVYSCTILGLSCWKPVKADFEKTITKTEEKPNQLY